MTKSQSAYYYQLEYIYSVRAHGLNVQIRNVITKSLQKNLSEHMENKSQGHRPDHVRAHVAITLHANMSAYCCYNVYVNYS